MIVTDKGCGLKLNDRAGFTESELESLADRKERQNGYCNQ